MQLSGARLVSSSSSAPEEPSSSVSLLERGADAAAAGMAASLELAAFALQFLDWWWDTGEQNRISTRRQSLKTAYSRNNNSPSRSLWPSQQPSSTPPPPDFSPSSLSKTDCPICGEPRRNETLVPSSG